MGKKQRQYDALMAQYQALINQMRQPSPYESQINSELGSITNFLNSKDYRNLPTGVNIDLLGLSDQKRMQDMLRGSGPTGTAAKGALAPALQQQADLDNNQLARDWGGAYEQKVGELMDRKDNLLGSLQGIYSNRMGAALQGQQNQLTNFLNRPKGFNWGSLVSGLISAAPGIMAAF